MISINRKWLPFYSKNTSNYIKIEFRIYKWRRYSILLDKWYVITVFSACVNILFLRKGHFFSEWLIYTYYHNVCHVNKIKWKLLTGRGQLGIYLISLSCTSDQLDIFHCALLKQKYFDKKALQVVGIAEGREEAIFLVQQMLQDTMDAGMEADIKGYLQKTFTSGKGGGGWQYFWQY